MTDNDALDIKRQALINRISAQRQNCRRITEELRHPLEVADKGISVTHYIVQRPLILIAAVGVLVIAKPRRIISGFRTGIKAWQIWQTFSPLFLTKK